MGATGRDDQQADAAGGGLPPGGTVADRVDGLLAALLPEEQARLTSGADMWHGERIARLDVRALKVSDGPAGVRGERFVGSASACVPCGSALGASWDPALVAEIGALLGRECRAKGVHLLLAPTVNLHRTPLAGRNFECYSEDPHLSAAVAVGFIRGVQSTGVGACVKHLVANDSEFERHTISSEVDERTLRELSLVPFEAAVREADVAAVMSAYNRLNGTYCAEHEWLLTTVLRREWGFEGLVVSDWWGTMSPASAGAGLDLEMPGPAVHLGSTSAQRIAEGTLDPSVVAEQARRVLELSARTGALDAGESPESSVELPGTRELLRRAAAATAVLLRNEPVDGRPVLPLDPGALRTLAVVGPNATDTALLGGGSAWVNAHHQDPLVDGIRRRLGDAVEVVVERGVDASLTCPPIPARVLRPSNGSGGPHGLTVEYFGNRTLEGEPVHVEVCGTGRLSWIDDDTVPSAGFSARLTATLVAEEDGPHTFGLTTAGTGRLWLDGELICDNTEDPVPGTSFFGMGTEEVRATVELRAGSEHELRCEYVSYRDLAVGGVQIGLLRPVPDDGIERAAAAAARADAAVVVVGLNADWETEGHDRADTALPGRQGELIRAVLEANPRTVVVVNAGAVVDLDDIVAAPSVLWIWYPGQEAADGVTDLLVGDAAPAGRLPTSFAARCEDHPAFATYPGSDGVVRYDEGLLLGYRGLDATGVDPVFCFGHGLTYGRIEWGEASLSQDAVGIAELGTTPLVVQVALTNPGDRPLREVVQVYVGDDGSGPDRPPRELRGFAAVELPPGGSTVARVVLDRRAFSHWDPGTGDWVVEPGTFRISVSRSSRDHHAVLPLVVR